jgi:hypothetical protein
MLESGGDLRILKIKKCASLIAVDLPRQRGLTALSGPEQSRYWIHGQ